MSQVQESSDCCINSKFSSAKKGYFEDDFLELFTKKLYSRSSIINRGYYIRFKAMEEVFQSWWLPVNLSSQQKFQIISLGAGYDTSFIRLKNKNQLPPCCHYIEVDFPGVMKRKYDLIKDVVDSDERTLFIDPAIVLHTKEYSLLGFDLTDISTFQKCLNHIGINYSAPTLFISECSITYIDYKSSENFISWVQNQFPNSSFAAYEQVYPDDAFGIVMRNHFMQVGCSLKSITRYPSEESQCERFRKLGWEVCSVITMFELFNLLSIEEKHRIQQLEMFDEYEMFHEKCHHYILVWASQGILSKSLPKFLQANNTVFHPEQSIVSEKQLNWKYIVAEDVTQRFGHQVLFVSPSVILISGGFGVVQKKHQRLGGIALYHLESKKYHRVAIKGENEELMGKRMFHTMSKLSNGSVIILGGRSSPKKVFKNAFIIQNLCTPAFINTVSEKDGQHQLISKDSSSSSVPKTTCSVPIPTWRHSASVVEIEGSEHIVLFGGCTEDQIASNGCFILNSETWEWSEITSQEHTPSPRHSHSAVTYRKNNVFVTGGLNEIEDILQSVHVLDCISLKWSVMSVSGLLPRYSHTSHICRDHLFLVGGVTSIAKYNLGVGIVNLKTLQAFEVLSPAQDPEYPILLTNHSSFLHEDEIVIIGGGGNCFSFGTHFNKKIISFNLNELL